MDSNKFNVSHITKPNGLEIINRTLNDRRTGINKLIINETFGTVKINVSSKILNDNLNRISQHGFAGLLYIVLIELFPAIWEKRNQSWSNYDNFLLLQLQ